MNNISNFEKVLMVVFGFLAAVGLLAFSAYRATDSKVSNTEVVIWGELDKATFDKFIKESSEVGAKKLKITYVQKNRDSIDEDLLNAIASGEAPDSIILSQNFIKKYYDKIYPISYETFPERKFKDTYIQEADLLLTKNGIFGIPFYVDPLVMYWNEDIFNGLGIATPPSKWSEFPILAQNISKYDVNANISNSFVSFGEYENVNNAKEILSTLIMQTGNQIVNYKDGNIFSYFSTSVSASSTDNILSAIDFYTEYSNPKKIVYSWNRSLPSSKQVFISDKLALYFGKLSEYDNIKTKNPNLNFDVSLVPQVVDSRAKITFGDLYYFIFLKNSKNLLNTYNTITFLTNPESSKIFIKKFDVAPVRKDIISLGTTDPIKDVGYKSALISRGWIDPDYDSTSKIFKDMIENIVTGKLKSNEAVVNAGIEIKNLIE
jgi:ABC-type glycerol-3-phosphate transport system substrate-binding protein